MSFPKKYSSSVKNIIQSSVIAVAFLASASVFAAPPKAVVGSTDIQITVPPIINAGLAIGGDMTLETSIGTVHGDSVVNGQYKVKIDNASVFGISAIVNAGLVIGGDYCGKVSVGSIGASTCTYGANGNFAAETTGP